MPTETAPTLSLVVPLYNEEACVRSVLEEAIAVLDSLPHSYEVIAVDDGSDDATGSILGELAAQHPALRVFRLTPNSGQSAAFGAGFKRARGSYVMLIDGDGQNDPHDIPLILTALESCDVCCGYRALRRDTWSKRLGSRMANAIRRSVLDDTVRDTGCSLKGFRREFVQDLPMTLKGMHRFLPALVRMRGARLTQIPVNHRPRSAGESKYTNWGRLKETIADLRAVRWMQRRHRCFEVQAMPPAQ